MAEPPRKPAGWSLALLPGGGFRAQRRDWLTAGMLLLVPGSLAFLWALLWGAFNRHVGGLMFGLIGFGVFGPLTYATWVSGKALAVRGELLIAENRSWPSWQLEVQRLPTPDIRALKVKWEYEFGEDQPEHKEWQLHAQLEGERWLCLLSDIRTEREAEWLHHVAAQAMELREGPAG